MTVQIVVSISGLDRPGLFNELTVKTKALSGKWLSNKITHLDGYFAGLLKLQIDPDNLDDFKSMVSDFSDITVEYHEASENSPEPSTPIKLVIEGQDRSGLTSDITHLFNNLDVQVTHYESQRYPVTGLGTDVFEAKVDLQLPASLSIEQLKSDLEALDEKIRVNTPA